MPITSKMFEKNIKLHFQLLQQPVQPPPVIVRSFYNIITYIFIDTSLYQFTDPYKLSLNIFTLYMSNIHTIYVKYKSHELWLRWHYMSPL